LKHFRWADIQAVFAPILIEICDFYGKVGEDNVEVNEVFEMDEFVQEGEENRRKSITLRRVSLPACKKVIFHLN
jgi:hypothetical protein